MANGLSRGERKAQILRVLQSRWLPHSTHALARAVGMKPSAHFRHIVYEMFEAKEIGGFESHKENGRKVFYWYDLDRDERHGQKKLDLVDVAA